MKRFLVLGSGAREHALCWRLAHEAEVHCTPGNPGIAEDVPCYGIKCDQIADLLTLAKRLAPVTIVVGPEDPLINGIADVFRAEGFPVFGPGAAGAQLEGSKRFSKSLMKELSIPTAEFETFTEFKPALKYAKNLHQKWGGVVVKASGNALGKGAIVCPQIEQAESALQKMLVEKELGEAGSTVVVEAMLHGFEFSLLTLVSGTEIKSLPVAQDYKRAFDGDEGPNTGGMGSYCPADLVTADLIQQSEDTIVRPIVQKLADSGSDYRGILFSGILVADGKPYCLEYNVRFGDPETQSVMMKIVSGLGDALAACANSRPIPPLELDMNPAVTVVIAAPGYPDHPAKGQVITVEDQSSNGKLFFAGVKQDGNKMVVSGGRVISASATGSTIKQARESAYKLAQTVKFEGAWSRSDIGKL